MGSRPRAAEDDRVPCLPAALAGHEVGADGWLQLHGNQGRYPGRHAVQDDHASIASHAEYRTDQHRELTAAQARQRSQRIRPLIAPHRRDGDRTALSFQDGRVRAGAETDQRSGVDAEQPGGQGGGHRGVADPTSPRATIKPSGARARPISRPICTSRSASAADSPSAPDQVAGLVHRSGLTGSGNGQSGDAGVHHDHVQTGRAGRDRPHRSAGQGRLGDVAGHLRAVSGHAVGGHGVVGGSQEEHAAVGRAPEGQNASMARSRTPSDPGALRRRSALS